MTCLRITNHNIHDTMRKKKEESDLLKNEINLWMGRSISHDPDRNMNGNLFSSLLFVCLISYAIWIGSESAVSLRCRHTEKSWLYWTHVARISFDLSRTRYLIFAIITYVPFSERFSFLTPTTLNPIALFATKSCFAMCTQLCDVYMHTYVYMWVWVWV